MIIDEFLIALGLKVDNADIQSARDLGSAVEDLEDSADGAAGGLGRAYDATDGFVSAIEGALGVVGFFTGVLGGLLAATHGVISELETLIEDEKLLTKVTKDQLDQAKKYNDSVDNLSKRYNSLRVAIAFTFLPTLQSLINRLDELLKVNQDLIVKGFNVFLDAISKVFQVIGSFIRFIDLIVERTLGWETTLYVLAAALLYVNRAVIAAFLTNPVFLIIAAIAGLLILIDDFITYLDGGESEFGEFWGAMLEYIEVITPALQKLWDLLIEGASYAIEAGVYFTQYFGGALVDTIEALTAIWTIFVALLTGDFDLLSVAWDGLIENLLSAFTNFAQLFEPLAQLLVRIFVSVFDRIRTYVVGVFNSMVQTVSAFISRIAAVLANVFNIVTAPFRLAFDFIVNTFNRLPSLIGNIISKLPGVNAISSIGSAVTSGVNRIVNNIGGQTSATINVTAPNAISAANQTANALSNVQAQRNLGGQAIA